MQTTHPFQSVPLQGIPTTNHSPVFLDKNNKYVHLGGGKKMKMLFYWKTQMI